MQIDCPGDRLLEAARRRANRIAPGRQTFSQIESVVVGMNGTHYSTSLILNRNFGPGNNGSLLISNGAANCSYRSRLRIGTKKQRAGQDHHHLQAKLLQHTNLQGFSASTISARDSSRASEVFGKSKR